MSENVKQETEESRKPQEKSGTWLDHAVTILVESYRVFLRNDMSVFSGYTALYMLMAMVPFFALAAGMINFLPEEVLKESIDMFVSVLPGIPEVKAFAGSLLALVSPEGGAVVVSISLISLLWSASKGVSALQLGLMRISENEQPYVKRTIFSLFYTFLFILLIPSLLIFQVLRSLLLDLGDLLARVFSIPKISEIFSMILDNGYLVSAAAILVVMVIVYTRLQGRSHRLRQQLPGAIFTTVFWLLASSVFEWFITKMWNASSLYGSFAAIYLIAWWMKIIIMILFFGASLNEAIYLYTHSKIENPMDVAAVKEYPKTLLPEKRKQKQSE